MLSYNKNGDVPKFVASYAAESPRGRAAAKDFVKQLYDKDPGIL